MTIPYEEFKARLLANPEVKAEYDARGRRNLVSTGDPDAFAASAGAPNAAIASSSLRG